MNLIKHTDKGTALFFKKEIFSHFISPFHEKMSEIR